MDVRRSMAMDNHLQQQHRQAQHELNRSPMISRPRTYLPGIKGASPHHPKDRRVVEHFLESQQTRADVNYNNNMRTTSSSLATAVPSNEKILKVESMHPHSTSATGNHQHHHHHHHHQSAADESQDDSPRTVFRARSAIPNAGALAMVGTKSRSGSTADVLGRHGNNTSSISSSNNNYSSGNNSHMVVPDRKESSEHFYLKEKRAEARQAFLFSKKLAAAAAGSSGEASTTAGGRAAAAAWGVSGASDHPSSTAVQDVHVDTSVIAPQQQQQQQCHNIALLTRCSFENAVPIEGGSVLRNPALRASEQQDLLDALSQRAATPQRAEKAEADILRQLSSHKQLEVPISKQGAKGPKEWAIATETLDSHGGDADGASETSVDKCGQPSPVSVLDSPFEVETSSPVDFKELRTDIQDLRLRLPLLRLDGGERSAAILDSLQAREKLNSQNLIVRHTENSLESTESAGSSITSTSFSVYRDLDAAATIPQGGDAGAAAAAAAHLPVDRTDIDGLPCPEGRQEELLYVRNLLVASGFTEGATVMVGRWHSPNCPLDPNLFENLEDYYVDAELQVALEHGNVVKNSSSSKSSCLHRGSSSPDAFYRRLLFDVVNEVLLQLLGPYLRFEPWIQPASRPLLRPVPTNRQLVKDTWLQICTYFLPRGVEEFEALDCLMGRDVASSKGAPWLESHGFCEQIGLELERTIFERLLEEAVYSLVSPPANQFTKQKAGRRLLTRLLY